LPAEFWTLAHRFRLSDFIKYPAVALGRRNLIRGVQPRQQQLDTLT